MNQEVDTKVKEEASITAENIERVIAEESSGIRSKARTLCRNKKFLGVLGVVVVLAIIGYVSKANTYKDKFMGASIINGIDVSEQDAATVKQLVKDQVESYSLSITFPDGTKEMITGDEINLKYTDNESVETLMNEQNTLGWIGKLFGVTREYTVPEDYTYDMDALKNAMLALPEFQEENITEAENACMKFDEENNCIVAVEEIYGNRPNEEKVMETLTQLVNGSVTELTMDDSYYVQPEILVDDAEMTAQIDDMNDFLSTKITVKLHDGSKYVLSAKKLRRWLRKDKETNWYFISDKKLKKQAEKAARKIAKKDDVLYESYSFQSTISGVVDVPCTAYGWTVDQEAEAEQLYLEVSTRTSAKRKPNYSREDEEPVGDTYVEIDIKNQEVFVYVDGKVVVDVPCVSGTDTVSSRRSDRGLFHIYKKLRNHTMLGPRDSSGKPSYSSHTNFATYYNGGEALHDASWRSRFGGTTYIYSGSHGCINLSYSSAQAVYENTEIGMPVLVFG